ncbi:MAG: integrase [Thermoleophilaceae bacterium]|jgi:integrase|nr:integrase [Thermoleophilaceae bacterium]
MRSATPDGLTPHSLRRTFASVLVALGRDPAVVMRQMGHTTPHMTLGVYAAAMVWGDDERRQLRALVEGRFEVPDGRELGNGGRTEGAGAAEQRAA